MENTEAKYKKTFLIVGIVMAATELIKQLLLTFAVGQGSYQWWYFPWQLCSIPMYACIIAGVCRSRKVYASCLAFISDFGLLAGICAFLDTSGFQYELAILTVHSYLWHIVLIALGIYAWYVRAKCRVQKLAFCGGFLIYLSACVIAEIINVIAFDNGCRPINMFYISPRYLMTQVYIKDLAPVIGNSACILLYIAVTVAGALIIELIGSMITRPTKDLGKE
uniref:Integral membrane protein n=1 Tax=uncultured bacterium fosmid pJB39A3 TaxID=1478063 RepID=A0A0H3U7J6_9BACT|nr:hypothetical protein [uncultured bacterium fosmid pJB39A3]